MSAAKSGAFTIHCPPSILSRLGCSSLQIKQLQLPAINGGDDAKRTTVHLCQLAAPQLKPTDIWFSRLPSVADALQIQPAPTAEVPHPAPQPRYVCPGVSRVHKHVTVRGKTSDSVRYHPRLVAVLAEGHHKSYLKRIGAA